MELFGTATLNGDVIRLFDAEIAFNAESVTRSEITQEDIDGSKATVKVYATKDGSVFYDSKEIKRQSTGKWYVNVNQKDTWVDGSDYSFYGYAYNTTDGLTVDDSGKQITVNQPTTYDELKMVDYLLSYKFDVADGSGTSGNVMFNSTGTEYSITMLGGLVTISSGNNYIRQKSTATNVGLGTYSDGRNWKFYQFVIDMP